MRLTDRARAATLKEIIYRMEAGGYEVAEENKIYVKLAEYENAEEPKLYLCDADKRPQCRATACYKNGGCCKLTQHKEFARIDENGNAIEYKEGG